MEIKIQKTGIKSERSFKCVRITTNSEKKADRLLTLANKKKVGRKVKLFELIELAVSLVTEEHLKMLQEQSMTNEDRKEVLRQKYIELRGQISKDEFTGFMMGPAFQEFLKEVDNPLAIIAS